MPPALHIRRYAASRNVAGAWCRGFVFDVSDPNFAVGGTRQTELYFPVTVVFGLRGSHSVSHLAVQVRQGWKACGERERGAVVLSVK
jgi:hypothetical protein